MKHTDMGLVTKFIIVSLTLICRLSLDMSDRVKMCYFILFFIFNLRKYFNIFTLNYVT